MKLHPIQSELRKTGNSDKAKQALRFFKTWPGEYGEGDIFLGVTVPETRKIVWKYRQNSSLHDAEILLQSDYHEERLAGLYLLVFFSKIKQHSISELAEFYMKYHHRINNWDLVDTSAEHIIWPYIEKWLTHEERVDFIQKCITSDNLWVNRIIVIASFYQIKHWNEKLTFYIVPYFLKHPHDLMHKACGWMLREVWKRIDEWLLIQFLDIYAIHMPRTMLRYAIERFNQEKREYYLGLWK